MHYGENPAPIISLNCVNAKGAVPIKIYKSKEQIAYEIKIPDKTKVYLVVNISLEVKFTVELKLDFLNWSIDASILVEAWGNR